MRLADLPVRTITFGISVPREQRNSTVKIEPTPELIADVKRWVEFMDTPDPLAIALRYGRKTGDDVRKVMAGARFGLNEQDLADIRSSYAHWRRLKKQAMSVLAIAKKHDVSESVVKRVAGEIKCKLIS